MRRFSRLLVRAMGAGDREESPAPTFENVDNRLDDAEWFRASEGVYRESIDRHYGSPDTMAAPGEEHYGRQNFGVALLFFAKSVNMLHTAYGSLGMQTRRSSAADRGIVDGFVKSLGASRAMHPSAPVGDIGRQGVLLLGAIAGDCDAARLPSDLYRRAAAEADRELVRLV